MIIFSSCSFVTEFTFHKKCCNFSNFLIFLLCSSCLQVHVCRNFNCSSYHAWRVYTCDNIWPLIRSYIQSRFPKKKNPNPKLLLTFGEQVIHSRQICLCICIIKLCFGQNMTSEPYLIGDEAFLTSRKCRFRRKNFTIITVFFSWIIRKPTSKTKTWTVLVKLRSFSASAK